MSDNSHYLFKHHPETCDPDDVWGQVKRTVGGKPLPAEQITLIIESIRTGLDIGQDDLLLDLCCGNGALTTQLFADCRGGLGVDYSPFLIEVANQRFVNRPSEAYLLADALDYLRTEPQPERFTKVLCYGAFPYFDPAAAQDLLMTLNRRFTGATRVFLGQLPDKARMDAFFTKTPPKPGEADDPGSLLGLWRTQQDLGDLGRAAGWNVACRVMPETFYASHYRYDAILTRP